jgi:RNA polymerase sigma factor (sigma-70 family)
LLNSLLARSRILTETKGQRDLFPAKVNPADRTSLSDILPKVAAGEPRAMDECIQRYAAIVYTLVTRYLKDATEAEDLIQDIFTEIWKKAAVYDPTLAGESTFVGMIARRRSIDFLRRRGRQPDFEPLTAAESIPLATPEAPAFGCDPESVRSSVAALPEDTRQLFHLFFDDGFTHPEIAEKTGLPLGTVKTRLRRGLIALREQLQRLGTTPFNSAS